MLADHLCYQQASVHRPLCGGTANKSSFPIALICSARRWILSGAITNQGISKKRFDPQQASVHRPQCGGPEAKRPSDDDSSDNTYSASVDSAPIEILPL